MSKRGSGGPAGASGGMVSQEQLVRKAAGLCYLLSNEGTISLVSEGSSESPVLSHSSISVEPQTIFVAYRTSSPLLELLF